MNPRLVERLRRADPTAYVHVDVTAVDAESSKRTQDQWDGATGTGFTTLPTGGARLSGTLGALVEHAVAATGYLTDIGGVSPLPFDAVRIRWNGAEPSDIVLQRLKLYLNPRVDGGQPQEVARWRVRLYAVTRVNTWAVGLSYDLEVVPLGDYVDVTAGSTAGLVTFDFQDQGVFARGLRPKAIKAVLGDAEFILSGLIDDYISQSVTFVTITALTATGAAAGNAGLGYDSAQEVKDTGGNELATRTLNFHVAVPGQGVLGAWLDQGDAGGAPIMAVEVDSYIAATATFEDAGNRLDLGATPTNTVEFLARGEVPPGTSLTFEVRNDADTDWVAFVDGDTTDDLAGVGKAQTYKVRVTLTPDAGGDISPIVRLIGVREVTARALKNLTTIEGPRWAVDPRTLKGEIGEATLTALRDGDQDFRDALTDLLAAYHIGELTVEVFIADPNLDRADWLHVETFLIDETDYTSEAGITLTLVTHLARLKQTLPRPALIETSGVNLTFTARTATVPARITRASGSWITDGYDANDLITVAGATSNDGTYVIGAVTSATVLSLASNEQLTAEGPAAGITVSTWRRRPYQQANQTLKDVWADLVDAQIALPGRQRGPGVEDDTTQISQTIRDSDVKDELDAIAAIAGGGNITSQGQVKFSGNLFEASGIVATFPTEEITVLEMRAGLRHRVPESWVDYDWEEGEERFRAQVRGVNTGALTNLGEAYIEPARVDEALGRWVSSDSLAQTLADRDVRFRGAGIPTWRFRSTYCYPELEPGDLVAVETRQFVLRDPVTAATVRGRLWALAVIVAVEGCDGKDFTVWIRQFADFLPAYTTYDLTTLNIPPIEAYFTPLAGSPGQVQVRLASAIGATIYYAVQDAGAEEPPYGDARYLTYSGPITVTQLDDLDRLLTAYATRNGLRSPIRSWLIDKDTSPEVTLAILQYDATNVQPQWVADDDVVFISLHRKKNGTGNGWPTLNNESTGILDEAQLIGTIYVRADGGSFDRTGTPLANVVDSTGTLRTGIGGTKWRESGYTTSDVVKCIAVPFDRQGNPGARATASLTVTASGSAALTTFTAALTDGGTSCADRAEITVSWTPNGSVADGTHDLLIYRRKNGGAWELVTTEASPASVTSYVDTLDTYEDSGSGVFDDYEYRYELVDGVPNVLDQGQSGIVSVETWGGVCLS